MMIEQFKCVAQSIAMSFGARDVTNNSNINKERIQLKHFIIFVVYPPTPADEYLHQYLIVFSSDTTDAKLI